MKAFVLSLIAVGLSISLSSCGKKNEAPTGHNPVLKPDFVELADESDIIENVYLHSEFVADFAELSTSEWDLHELGFQFKMVELSDEESAEAAQLTWNEEALETSDVDPEKALTALKKFLAASIFISGKYGNAFALKLADGSLIRAKLKKDWLINLTQKRRLVEKTIEELSDDQPTPEFEEEQEPETEPTPAPTPTPVPTPTVKPSKPAAAPVPPLPTRKPSKEKPQKPVPPSRPQAAKPSKPAKVTCANYMALILKRAKYNCRVVGKYGSIDINVSTDMRLMTAKGRTWNHRGKRGVETKYAMKLGQYEVPLFTLNIAPLAAQSTRENQIRSTETCSANGLKIATETKPPRKNWGAPEITEVKPSKAGGLIVLIKKADMNLRLNCR